MVALTWLPFLKVYKQTTAVSTQSVPAHRTEQHENRRIGNRFDSSYGSLSAKSCSRWALEKIPGKWQFAPLNWIELHNTDILQQLDNDRQYADNGEELERRQIWEKNVENIDKHNADFERGLTTFTMVRDNSFVCILLLNKLTFIWLFFRERMHLLTGYLRSFNYIISNK